MEYAGLNARTAAQASANARAEFIRLTYLHLGGAVLTFAATAGVLVNTVGEQLTRTLLGSQVGWLLVLGAFMAVGWVADRWARASHNPGQAYAGLALYVVAQAVIMTPMLWIAGQVVPGAIGTAGVLTGIVFGGLTAFNFMSAKDFSFMRGALAVGGLAAMGMIVVSLLFGFSLGTFFSAAMVVLAAGYILYYTSNVMHHYPVGSHVAASLALFSAVALLFWYILRLVMAFASSD